MELQAAGISFASMKTAFSVEALSKQFYNELFDWFQWSLSDEIGVTFPNAEVDGKKNIEERMIRLITRLMFVWFIKQKKLVPEQLFKVDTLNNILKTFDPYSVTEGNYYNAILQNLFFATLNNEIGKRAFATEHRGPQNQAEDYGIKTLFRNPKNDTWFKIGNEEVLQCFSVVPFLNGGLFECLDKEQPDSRGRIVYSDGFSREAGRHVEATHRAEHDGRSCVHDVAWRQDLGEGNRQRNLVDNLRRHTVAFPRTTAGRGWDAEAGRREHCAHVGLRRDGPGSDSGGHRHH